MFPNVYGFSWSAGHLIFLGLFFSVVLVIAAALGAAAYRSARNVRAGKAGRIAWLSDFHDLPKRDRACRHELTGEFRGRVCDNAFDCARCEMHARLSPPEPAEDPAPFGLVYPADRLYHRGHAWVREEPDGTVAIGLDDFASRLIGEPARVELPKPGERLEANGPGWTVRGASGVVVPVRAPVAGEVIETGGPGRPFYLKLRGCTETRHLLRGGEVRAWIGRELERLQLALSAKGECPTLADGGVLVDDVPRSYPKADWDNILGGIFLQP